MVSENSVQSVCRLILPHARTARLDIPGLLQHVIVRGIERRDIFRDDKGREVFVSRLAKLAGETKTQLSMSVLGSDESDLDI